MGALFANGAIVDAILLFTVLEAAILLAYRHRTGRGVPAQDLLAALAAGLCLMLALRAALVGSPWPWIALWLAAALAAHLADLRRRWRSAA